MVDEFLPVWRKKRVSETVIFINENNAVSAKLAFEPEEIYSVTMKSGKRLSPATYRAEGRVLKITDATNIPFVERKWLNNENVPSFIKHENERYKVEGCLLWDAVQMYGYQIEIDYSIKGPERFPSPVGEVDLPVVRRKLTEEKQLKTVLLGDSISNAANSSYEMGITNAVPAWYDSGFSFAREIFSAEMDFVNASRSGYGTEWAMTAADKVFSENKPDLAIIAFGMNDAPEGLSKERFASNISFLTETARKYNAECEFILISTPLPNPACRSVYLNQGEYIKRLKTMEGKGVTVVDMTSVYKFLMERKDYCSISGNNLNHPNDFTYGFYTDALKYVFYELKGQD